MTKRIIAAAFIALGLLGAAAGTATAAPAAPHSWYHG